MATILVVDDNSTNRFVFEAVLERAGHQVRLASTAEEAARLCESLTGLDLTIVDVILGRSSGGAVGHELRRLCPGVPILFVSGSTLEDLGRLGSLHLSEFSGPVDFLPKPFTAEKLMMAVSALLRAGSGGTEARQASGSR